MNFDTFFGLDCLMEAIRPTAAGHEPAGEFIHNDYLTVLDHIISVTQENDMGFERLLQVMDMADTTFVIDILHAQDLFATMYHVLGIDPTTLLNDRQGRPIPVLGHGTPITELI